MKPLRFLHCHSTFAAGGKELRSVRLINAFEDAAGHSILSAVPGAFEARAGIAPGIESDFPADAPALAGRPSLVRLRRLALYMRGFDLVLTYNWGGFDAVMARRLFGGPPLVHHEDGFNEDEMERRSRLRSVYRRLGLPAAFRLVVPSRLLERIAREEWAQPSARVARIPNGVAVECFARPPQIPIPGLERRPGEIVIGTIAGLRAVKNLPRLVRAFAAMRCRSARLVIVGSGPECERITDQARALGVADRLIMPGRLAHPHEWIGHLDIFALSSDSEQAPIALLEAMAAGLPTAATAVGDVASMVASDNLPLIVGRDDELALAAALDALVEAPGLRRAIGDANREKARAEHDEAAMIASYRALYGAAIGRPGALAQA